MKHLILVLFALVLAGCVTTSVPPGCENSVIYPNKVMVDTSATVMVNGARVYALTKPVEYQRIHDACVAAAQLLRSQPISLGNLTTDPYLQIMAPLLGLIPMDRVLSQCDRDYLAAYLSMI